MKTLFPFLFLALLVFVSCKSKSDGPSKKEAKLSIEEQLAKHIETELASGERNDTIVLDFRFGMTRDQLYRHTKRQASKGKMYPVQKNSTTREYVYDLRLRSIGKVRTYFDAYYYGKTKNTQKVYKIECLPRVPKNVEAVEVLEETLEIFSTKYGEPHFALPVKDVENCKEYLWIDGNRRIELSCDDKDRVIINYIDMPAEKIAGEQMDI